MDEQTWPAVLERLLTLGRPVGFEPSEWGRSVVAGMTRGHVPNLIGMLDDASLNDEATEEPRCYAPVHAWRALGHFKAVEAVEALIRCLEVRQRWKAFDDWSIEEVPKVLRAFGPEAIPEMVKAIADPATEGFSAMAVAEALARIAAAHPEQRGQVVAQLIEVGERFAERAKEANDGVVMALLDLKAVEAVPLLRRIFHAKAVNQDVVGDWGDVRRELELERQEGDPPERRPGESVHHPDSPVGKLARRLSLEDKWKAMQAPSADPPAAAAPVKHTAKWHRKQAKKHKQQTRRC